MDEAIQTVIQTVILAIIAGMVGALTAVVFFVYVWKWKPPTK